MHVLSEKRSGIIKTKLRELTLEEGSEVVPVCSQNNNDWLTLPMFPECQRLVNVFFADHIYR